MSEKSTQQKGKTKSTHKTHVEDTLGKKNMEFPVSVHNLCLGMSCWLKKNKKLNPKNKTHDPMSARSKKQKQDGNVLLFLQAVHA